MAGARIRIDVTGIDDVERRDHPRAGGDHHVETRVPRTQGTQPFRLTVSNVAGKNQSGRSEPDPRVLARPIGDMA